MNTSKLRAALSSFFAFVVSFVPAFFTSGWKGDESFIKNLISIHVDFHFFFGNIRIPYRFFLAASVILLYAGFSQYLKPKKN